MFFRKKKITPEKKQSAIGSVLSLMNVGQPVWSTRDYKSFADEGYVRNVITNRCVSLISKGVASLEWEVFRGDKKQDQHDILKLLARPNPYQAQCDFFEAVISFKLLSGNSYIEAAYPSANPAPSIKPPRHLYVHRPDRMKIIKGTKGQPSAYEYELDGAKVRWPVSTINISNILHIKSFNPIDDWYGLSNIESGAYAIDQHNSASSWNQALLQNSARPSGALVVKAKENEQGKLSDEQFTRLQDQIEEQRQGSQNAGKPLLLEGGLEWQEMGVTPKDMDWLQGKHSAARDVALAFGVPSQLLGIPGDSTYNNMQEARLSLWEQTILPIADELTSHLNAWLVPRFGDDLTLLYDKENIDALRIKREAQRTSLESTTFMTTNEKRAAMGLDEVDGGDELLVDSNKIPINIANDLDFNNNNESNVSKAIYLKTLSDLGFSKEEIKCLSQQDGI